MDIASLRPRQWLNDNIINAFCQLQANIAKANGLDVHFLNTYISSFLITNKLTQGLKRGLSQQKYWKCKALLMPVNIEGIHWALFIVDFQRHMILYCDSLRYEPKKQYLTSILAIVLRATTTDPTNNEIRKRSFYAPDDITRQKDGASCGIHVCLRVHAFCDEVILPFSQIEEIEKKINKFDLNIKKQPPAGSKSTAEYLGDAMKFPEIPNKKNL